MLVSCLADMLCTRGRSLAALRVKHPSAPGPQINRNRPPRRLCLSVLESFTRIMIITGYTMNRFRLLVILSLLLGCSAETPEPKNPQDAAKAMPEPAVSTEAPAVPEDLTLEDGAYQFPGEIEFDGMKWTRAKEKDVGSDGRLYIYVSPYREDVLFYHQFPPGHILKDRKVLMVADHQAQA